METLSVKWAFLESELNPLLVESLKLYGVQEAPGNADNPVIMGWAKALNVPWYDHDSIPWCGLDMAYVLFKAGYAPPREFLAAISFSQFGVKCEPGLGAIMVFKRPGGAHVGLYVGENATAYYILGGNQGDKHCITAIVKERLFASRRPTQQPQGRRVYMDGSEPLSTNES